MRWLSALSGAMLVCGTAWAGPPKVVQIQSQIDVAVGEVKVIKFDESFGTADLATKDVADIVPQSDHTLVITGLAAGSTVLFLKDEKGSIIYAGAIVVAPAPGHLVKLYGLRNKDYVGWYCSETGCGRGDLDKTLANGGRDPDEPTGGSVTVTRPTGDGGAVSTTRQYSPR